MRSVSLLVILFLAVASGLRAEGLDSLLGIPIGASPAEVRLVMRDIPDALPVTDSTSGAITILRYRGGMLVEVPNSLCAVREWMFLFDQGKLAMATLQLGVGPMTAEDVVKGYSVVKQVLESRHGRSQASRLPSAVPGYRVGMSDAELVSAMATSGKWLYDIWARRSGSSALMLDCRLGEKGIEVIWQDTGAASMLMRSMPRD